MFRDAATSSLSDCSTGLIGGSRVGPSSLVSSVFCFFDFGSIDDVSSVLAMRAMGSSSEDVLASPADDVLASPPLLPVGLTPNPADEGGPLVPGVPPARLPFSAAAAARSALACAARWVLFICTRSSAEIALCSCHTGVVIASIGTGAPRAARSTAAEYDCAIVTD